MGIVIPSEGVRARVEQSCLKDLGLSGPCLTVRLTEPALSVRSYGGEATPERFLDSSNMPKAS